MSLNIIKETIQQHIGDTNSVFVFPTQTAADLWADFTISNTDVTAVAMERFLAWDDFKGSSIKSHQKDKTSIPSTMRQIFTAQLLADNAENHFLQSLIPPEYSTTANGFINWIGGLLPSLSIWKKYFTSLNKTPDAEDKDLLKLYDLYKEFLDKHNLFDPAWEQPPFIPDENHYFIFFPEILSDYGEYKNLLENSAEDITLIHLPEEKQFDSEVQFYSNSRTELRSIALQLRKLHEEKQIPWNEIAISIPDMDSYGPYIDRELDLYEIPHVLKAARPLSSSGAGNLFVQIEECVSSDFTFESVKNLLLNSELPWKEPKLSAELIKFGRDNNCICSFKYNQNKIDVWEKSFSDNPGTSELLIRYYRNLKDLLTKIVNSDSFEKIRTSYFDFRNKFFNMDECPANTDKLISRCITELGSLIDLERDFPECKVPSPYSFFVIQLSNTNYLAQTAQLGVQILPYKTGATAPFSCHIILDASQSGISVIYKQLSFLREDKRKLLLAKEDPNVTEHFVQLYSMNSILEAPIFTCAQKTLTGYSQPSSYLTPLEYTDKDKEPAYLKEDIYLKEKSFLMGNTDTLTSITETEKNSFDFWKECQRDQFTDSEQAKTFLSQQIKAIRMKEGYYRISPTHLKYFLDCNRKWLLRYVTKLEPQINEAELMNPFAIGNLYHRILQLFCNCLKENKQTFQIVDGKLPEQHMNYLTNCLNKAIQEHENSYLARELLTTTKDSIFTTIKNTVTSFCSDFVNYSVYGTEVSFTYKMPDKNILCEGKIDCLLQNPTDGDFVLIDFKSSKGSVPANLLLEETPPDEYPDFQMPMYLYLLQHQEKQFPVGECYFYNIKDCEKKALDLPLVGPTMDALQAAIDSYYQYLEEDCFIENPRKDFSQCNSCDYRAVCRKVFNVGQSK